MSQTECKCKPRKKTLGLAESEISPTKVLELLNELMEVMFDDNKCDD